MKFTNKNMLTFFLMFFIKMVICMYFFIYFLKKKVFLFLKWEILFMNSNSFEFIMYIDYMTFSFLSVVYFISSLVCLYSMNYIKDNKKNQFINLIFMFVFSMMMLVLSLNIMSILIGWDGLGLISYILIIFFQSDKSKNSGMLTILLNRIGDILIIFSSWILFMKGGMNFLFYFNGNLNITLIIILASMTKSAQIPFSSWLPAAMAAPTPVSSLVHSSTLVTAGIYLMIRFNNYFNSMVLMNFILIISLITMFMSGITANYETDLKKIIALSTLSQLGFMMMTISMNFILLSFFHLLTHALFKSLLFLCAGIMLHNLKNNQNIYYMGKLINFMPLTIMCFNSANLSLCGFLFLSGFFSKDLIIENFLIMNNNNLLIFFFYMMSTSLTVSYTFRLIFFLSIFNMNSFLILNVKENKLFSMILLTMTIVSIFMGSVYNWTMMMIFYEPFMNKYMKIIIPMILIMGLYMTFFFFKKKMLYMSSLFFFNITINNLKKLPNFFINNTFNSTNFGFFEFFGSQGLYKYFMTMNKMNNMNMLSNFKTLTFISILIFIILSYMYFV